MPTVQSDFTNLSLSFIDVFSMAWQSWHTSTSILHLPDYWPFVLMQNLTLLLRKLPLTITNLHFIFIMSWPKDSLKFTEYWHGPSTQSSSFFQFWNSFCRSQIISLTFCFNGMQFYSVLQTTSMDYIPKFIIS